MAKLEIDTYYREGDQVKIYWAESNGVPVHECDQRSAEKIVEFINALPAREQAEYFCPHCGLFLCLIEGTVSVSLQYSPKKGEYGYNGTKLRDFRCARCDGKLLHNHIRKLSI